MVEKKNELFVNLSAMKAAKENPVRSGLLLYNSPSPSPQQQRHRKLGESRRNSSSLRRGIPLFCLPLILIAGVPQ